MFVIVLDLVWLIAKFYLQKTAGFLRRFRDPIRVPRIRENYHRVPKIRDNRVPTDPYRVPNIFF